MPKIEINSTNFKISGKIVEFPISKTQLNQLFGKERLVVLKYGQKHTWDKLGIMGHSSNGEQIESLYISLVKEDFDFSPICDFAGEILFDGKDILEFRKNNLDKLIKTDKYDNSGKFILKNISCWFNLDEEKVIGIYIENDDGKVYQHPLNLDRPIPISIHEKYNYLIELWENWKKEILKLVPINNQYFNLEYGITESEIKLYKNLEADINIPDEVIAFYKIYNVNYNAVTSAICFSTSEWEYDLIPFKQIKEEWEAIQDLNWDAPEELANSLAGYSPKVKANDYANPHWIPFAEGKNGDYLLFDTDPSESGIFGQIIELQNQSWKRDVIADSLSELLEKEITQLKKGIKAKYNFIIGKENNEENNI